MRSDRLEQYLCLKAHINILEFKHIKQICVNILK